jgi:hypothetical protein
MTVCLVFMVCVMNRDEGLEIMAPRAGLEPATY